MKDPILGRVFRTRSTLTNGLIGWWPLGRSSPDMKFCKDHSGYGNDARTVFGIGAQGFGASAAWPMSRSKTSVKFAGSGVDRMNIDNFNPGPVTQFSISLWFNASTVINYTDVRLFATSHTDADKHGMQLVLSSGGGIGLSVGDGSTNVGSASYGAFVATVNQWYHVVGILNGGTMGIYVNGVRQFYAGAFLGSSMAAGLGPASIGWSATLGGGGFIGSIDDVRWYNRELSPGEIFTLYAESFLPPEDSDRVVGAQIGVTTYAPGIIGLASCEW